MTEVGLSPRFARLKPREVSGGELQRAAIARALAAHPDLVVMDEPTSALDVSIRGQVLTLMQDLQSRHSLSYLIATHDLRTVRLVADQVIVMYLGQIVEMGPTEAVFTRPRHPYTLGLFYADDLAGRQILDGRQIQPALVGCNVGDVRQPDGIRPVGFEGTLQKVRGDAVAVPGTPPQRLEDQEVERALKQLDAVFVTACAHDVGTLHPTMENVYTLPPLEHRRV